MDRRARVVSGGPTVTPWDQQGCPVCRGQWERGEHPRRVAENVADHSELYRCDVCATLWLRTERYATAVAPEDIATTYGEYLSA